MSIEKFCVDCVWHVEQPAGYDWRFARCNSPQNSRASANPVTGEGGERKWAFCEGARAQDCGPSAAWFLAKRVTVEMDDACSKSAELHDGISEGAE